MALARLCRQVWTLLRNVLNLVLWRSWFSTCLQAVALPTAYVCNCLYLAVRIRRHFVLQSYQGDLHTSFQFFDLFGWTRQSGVRQRSVVTL
jgi:hypothetical protein